MWFEHLARPVQPHHDPTRRPVPQQGYVAALRMVPSDTSIGAGTVSRRHPRSLEGSAEDATQGRRALQGSHAGADRPRTRGAIMSAKTCPDHGETIRDGDCWRCPECNRVFGAIRRLR